MLRICIEIHPYGRAEDRHSLHVLYIANVGGTAQKASYHAWLDVDPREWIRNRPEPHGIVKNYLRAKGPVRLTELCLQAIRESQSHKKAA